jgi:hypothetical protein
MPVALHCRLCPGTPPIPSTSDRALMDAGDHVVDQHRAALLADPDGTERAVTVSLPARPAPLRRAVIAA